MSMMVILFLPHRVEISRDSRVEVSSIRLGEAVKRLTTQLVSFLFPRVYIYIYIYAGCSSSSSSASYGTTSSSPYWMLPTKQLQLFFLSSLDRWQHFRQDRIEEGINQYTLFVISTCIFNESSSRSSYPL